LGIVGVERVEQYTFVKNELVFEDEASSFYYLQVLRVWLLHHWVFGVEKGYYYSIIFFRSFFFLFLVWYRRWFRGDKQLGVLA
jgi:hypothetical protein